MSMWYNHFGKFIIECWYALLRFHDRGYKCKRDKHEEKYEQATSRLLIEEDYEDLHTATPFELSKRYANILYMVGLTFFFSSGIVILYPIALAYFIFGYFVDKILLVYINRKPLMYDGKIAEKTLDWFKWILVGHFILGVFMYANEHIVYTQTVSSVDESGENPRYQELFGNDVGNWLPQYHILVFFWFAIALGACFICVFIALKIYASFFKKGKENYQTSITRLRPDIYEWMSV